MFIGHHAVAFASKRYAPKISLGTMFFAVQLADILWPLFLMLGIEHARITPGITVVTPLDLYDYPFSHSLVTLLLWSLLAGGAYWAVRKYKAGALMVGVGVFSHWILDFLTHRPDMPLAPGSSVFLGLGLWNSFWGTVTVEVGLFAAGIWLYTKATAPKDKIGNYGLWIFVAFLLVSYAMNLFGPPPPNMTVISIGGSIGGWLLVLAAYWIDRHRISRTGAAGHVAMAM